MTAKLVFTLETAMYRAIQEKQYSAVASNAKVFMKLVGLEPKKARATVTQIFFIF